MMKAKAVAKKSEQFLMKMQNNGFEAEPVEFIGMEDILILGRDHCESCVSALMSDDIGPMIANKEELLERMLKYQEQIITAIAIIQPFTEEVRAQEANAYKTF